MISLSAALFGSINAVQAHIVPYARFVDLLVQSFSMALPMKKSVMKAAARKAMKKSTPMKAMARVMKKKAVSKIARGKLAKAVVLRGGKEKTASGHSRSDLMKNKRGRVVSKAQYAAGKKAFKNISRWAESVARARAELGIKGFCLVNGVHASTSERCTRALVLDEAGVQMDQIPARGVGLCGAEGGTFGSSSLCGDGSDFHGYAGAEHTKGNSGLHDETTEEERLQSRSGCRDAYDGQLQQPNVVRVFLDCKKAMEELIWSEVKKFKEGQMDGEHWDRYFRTKLTMMDFIFQTVTEATCGLWELGDSKAEHERLMNHVFSSIMQMISQEVQIRYFLEQQGLMEGKGLEMDPEASSAGMQGSASGSTEDVSRDVNLHAEEKSSGKSFYKEFAMKKKMKVACVDGNKVEQNFEQMGMHGLLRGGMTNMFEVLREEEPEDESREALLSDYFDSEAEEVSEITEHEQEASFHTTSSGGRSFYAEYFAQKMAVRGGAGGSNTTKNKKLTEAIGALAEVVRNFEATPDEPESVGQVVTMIGDVVKEWQKKMPTRNEMKKQLLKFHQILEKDAHQLADARASRDEMVGKGPQQSFYDNFVQRFQQDDEDGNDNKWTTKGKKGKGKGKGGKDKGKAANGSTLPRFDVMKIMPTKALTTWQVLGRELESAKEPTGKAVIMDTVERMIEYQALSKAHGLTNCITMIAKSGDEDLAGLSNPTKLWLPYLSNLALVQAVVATTTGEQTTLKGIVPVKKDGTDTNGMEKMVTLRMVVDLKLIKDKRLREHYKTQPHASLQPALGQCSFKEIKTHGWTVGDELLTGYSSVKPENVEEILRLSGKAGLFSSRLRQDVAEQPPVTWLKKNDGESDVQYHERAMERADACKVALTRRNGGGAYLGLLQEDDETRNRAWQISGIPHTWGPSSVKQWLTNNDWHVEAVKPPNGKFRTWAIQGYVKSDPLRKNFAYQVKCGSKDCNITIYRWQKQRKPNAEEKERDKQLKGSRWWSADMSDPIEEGNEVSPTERYTPEVAATVMDVDESGKSVDSQAGKRATADNGKNGSPEKKRTKKSSPAVTLQGGSTGPIGSLLINLGGSGECGWRALAWSIAVANKTPCDQAVDSIETLATTLRVKVINFLKVNCNRWKDNWCPDDAATATTEDGEPAKDYESFLKVLDRPRRWMCGLGLTAAALQMKCAIVIWQFDGNERETHEQSKWRRVAIIKGNKSDSGKCPILALVLHRGHYYGLRLPPLRKAWPREWLIAPEEADKNIPVTQSVDEAAELSAICRGGGHEECCTPVKTSVPKDIDAMLRSFSMRSSESRRRCGVEQMLRTCSTIASSKGGQRSSIKRNVFNEPKSWTCPICQERMELGKGRMATDAITRHLTSYHTAIFQNALEENRKRNRHRSGFGMAGLVKPVAFQEIARNKWAEEADFVCPYCEMALPRLSNAKRSPKHGRHYLLRLSKRQHLKYDCKYKEAHQDTTLMQYYRDAQAKFGQSLTCTEKWYQQTPQVETVKKLGHTPVFFFFPKSECAWSSMNMMVCSTCRKGLSTGYNARREKCRGIAGRRPYSPGPAFWQNVALNRKKKEAGEKLQMTRAEIDHAYAAVKGFRAQPSKRPSRAKGNQPI